MNRHPLGNRYDKIRPITAKLHSFRWHQPPPPDARTLFPPQKTHTDEHLDKLFPNRNHTTATQHAIDTLARNLFRK